MENPHHHAATGCSRSDVLVRVSLSSPYFGRWKVLASPIAAPSIAEASGSAHVVTAGECRGWVLDQMMCNTCRLRAWDMPRRLHKIPDTSPALEICCQRARVSSDFIRDLMRIPVVHRPLAARLVPITPSQAVASPCLSAPPQIRSTATIFRHRREGLW